MITCTRKLEWDAGHRVLGHESRCKHLHGHRYVAEVTVACPRLDSLGRVIDFGVVKQLLGKWVDDSLDHNVLLHPDDPLVKVAANGEEGFRVYDPLNASYAHLSGDEIFGGKAPYVMKHGNPTAENIAREIFEKAVELIPPPLIVTRVVVHETPNCSAAYSLD